MQQDSVGRTREAIRSFLRLSPSYVPSEIALQRQEDADGYTRSLVRYAASGGDQIEAFLFEPIADELHGAVIALHQHNSEWEIGKSEIAGLMGDPLQAFGPALARQGIAVLAPDAIGFESRLRKSGAGAKLAPPAAKPQGTPESWLQYYNQMAYRLVTGDFLMRKLLGDCSTALSVLQEHTSISRLGVVGHSFGGILALFLAAVDERLAYACSSGAVCSYKYKMANSTALEMSLVIPGFADQFDIDDLLRCVAPRQMLVVSADDDPYSADAEQVVVKALPEFEKEGCGDHLLHLRVPGQHGLDQGRFDAIVEWMLQQAQ